MAHNTRVATSPQEQKYYYSPSLYITKPKVLWSTCVSFAAIRNTSGAQEFMKVWRQKEILTQTPPIAGLELKWSPIQVLT